MLYHCRLMLLLLVIGTFYHGRVMAQVSPADSLKTLHAAEGVEVSLWASEPMVNNPTAIEVDSRGRVWIAEGLNYRMKQRQFDSMDRIEGADQIKVLSDTNGDGKADKVTVFAENIFPVPLGLAVEEIWKDGKQIGTRVYTGNSPDLLVLEDTDGDDKADRRYALLTGFRGVDSDHGLHGMTFGPDGRLYFTVGDARYGADKLRAGEATFDVLDQSGHQVSASNFGTTLRVNRDGTDLTVLSSGHRNNYEAAVDSFGNVFGSDNDDDGNRGCRMYWVIEGGQYGYHHPGSSRHWAEELPGIIPKLVGTGNGAPSGLLVYEGHMLPPAFQGAVLQIDSGTHQINSHPLHRHGGGFRSEYNVLLNGDDDWFRPVDLSVANDGSIFVCDWYDAGVGANRFSDQTTGRIYRLSSSVDEQEISAYHGENAIEGLQSPNATTRLAAREHLLKQGASSRLSLLQLFRSDRAETRSRALYVLHDLPQTGWSDTFTALSDHDPRLRETALQLVAESNEHLDRLFPLADDQDAGVRRALLLALRDVPTQQAQDALAKLIKSWDGRDRYYLEALRMALIHRDPEFLRTQFDDYAKQAIESGWDPSEIAVPPYYPVGSNDAFLRPEDELPASNLASRVIGLAWVLQRPESLPAMERLLTQNRSPSVEQAAAIALSGIKDPAAGRLLIKRFFAKELADDRKRDILKRLGVGVSGVWSELAKEASLRDVFRSAMGDHALQKVAIESIARCKLEGYEQPLMELASDDSQEVTVRATAMTSLGKMKHPPIRDLATSLHRQRKGPTQRRAALACRRGRDQLLAG